MNPTTYHEFSRNAYNLLFILRKQSSMYYILNTVSAATAFTQAAFKENIFTLL